MRSSMRKVVAKVTTVALAFAMTLQVVPGVKADAAKKPAFAKKSVTVNVKKSATVKIKGIKKKLVKKITVKSSKKAVATAKKSGKVAVKVTGKKTGSAKVTATLKLKKKVAKKKTWKLNLKVNVKGASTSKTAAPAATEDVYKINISPENESAATKGKLTYRDNVEWQANGSVNFVNTNGYNGGLFFNLAEDGSAVDISKYKYVKAVVQTVGQNKASDEVFVKAKSDSSGYWSGSDNFQKFEGADNVTGNVRAVYFDISEEITLDEVAMIGVQTKSNAEGKGFTDITVYSIELTNTKKENETFTGDAYAPAIKTLNVSLTKDNLAGASVEGTYQATFGDGYVALVNLSGYNARPLFKLAADGSKVDVSAYKYVKIIAKTDGKDAAKEELFVKAKSDESGYWNGSDNLQHYAGAGTGTDGKVNAVYFDISEDILTLTDVAMISAASKSNADGDGYVGTVVYQIAFTNTKDADVALVSDTLAAVEVPKYVAPEPAEPETPAVTGGAAEVVSGSGSEVSTGSAAEVVEKKTHKIDLTSSSLKKQSKFAGYVAAEGTANGIAFEKGKTNNWAYVDISKYLTDNSIDISKYSSIKLSYKIYDEDGTARTTALTTASGDGAYVGGSPLDSANSTVGEEVYVGDPSLPENSLTFELPAGTTDVAVVYMKMDGDMLGTGYIVITEIELCE